MRKRDQDLHKSRNSSKEESDQKRYHRRFDRKNDRFDEQKGSSSMSKMDKYEARYYEKFGKFRSQRE